MWGVIRGYLTPSIPDSYHKEFTDYTNSIDVFRAKITSIMFMFFSMARLLFALVIEGKSATSVPRIYYLYECAVMTVGMAVFAVVFYRLEKNVSDREAAIWVVGNFFTLWMLTWGATMALQQQLYDGQVTVYVGAVMSIAVVPLLAPIRLLVMYGLVHSLFLWLLPSFQHSPNVVLGHLINTSILVSLSWVISMIIYRYHLNLFCQTKLAEQQNHDLVLMNQKLEQLSNVDALTGVHNRRKFDEMLRVSWEKCRRERLPLSLIMVDIDLFKEFNDYYGHVKGDQCLSIVARALTECVRSTNDLVSRYGGDEFAILIPGTSGEAAFALAERIRQRVQGLNIPHANSSIAPQVTISLGVRSAIPARQEHWDDILNGADEALLAAKRMDRNRVVV